MSYGTGSVGLNLQFANYVFLFDRWWNPAIEDQAINRATPGAKRPGVRQAFHQPGHHRGAHRRGAGEKRQLFNDLIAERRAAAAGNDGRRHLRPVRHPQPPEAIGGLRDRGLPSSFHGFFRDAGCRKLYTGWPLIVCSVLIEPSTWHRASGRNRPGGTAAVSPQVTGNRSRVSSRSPVDTRMAPSSGDRSDTGVPLNVSSRKVARGVFRGPESRTRGSVQEQLRQRHPVQRTQVGDGRPPAVQFVQGQALRAASGRRGWASCNSTDCSSSVDAHKAEDRRAFQGRQGDGDDVATGLPVLERTLIARGSAPEAGPRPPARCCGGSRRCTDAIRDVVDRPARRRGLGAEQQQQLAVHRARFWNSLGVYGLEATGLGLRDVDEVLVGNWRIAKRRTTRPGLNTAERPERKVIADHRTSRLPASRAWNVPSLNPRAMRWPAHC